MVIQCLSIYIIGDQKVRKRMHAGTHTETFALFSSAFGGGSRIS